MGIVPMRTVPAAAFCEEHAPRPMDDAAANAAAVTRKARLEMLDCMSNPFDFLWSQATFNPRLSMVVHRIIRINSRGKKCERAPEAKADKSRHATCYLTVAELPEQAYAMVR